MRNLNTSNSQLGYYLAGLIEGDGCIWTSKRLKSNNGRAYNPQIVIAFHKKEKPLFLHLQKVLNMGNISKVKLKNTCLYRISEKNKLIEMINLINGKFRTPKIINLYKAINRLNLLYNLNIETLPLDKEDLLNNAWLTGMTDSDGNFHISLTGNYGLNSLMTRKRTICSFSITQRVVDKTTGLTCVPFMTEIADLFKCKINYKAGNAMVFVAQANNKHYLTKKYFDKYPLMTSKHLDYMCFLEGQKYLGKRLTDKEIIAVRAIKNSMNNKRTYFNWDHLKNFYK